MSISPRLAAIAVVIRGNFVLLVRRRNEPDAGLWGFPGGHVNLGERALEAAARELYEETGVIGQPLRYLTNVDIIIQNDNGGFSFHFLLAAVLCEYVSGDPIAADDVSDAQWWDVADVLLGRIACSKNVDTVLNIAVDKL